MSTVWLEKRAAARGMARFCAVTVTPTLFGSWAIVREWGRRGSLRERRGTAAQ